jgi:tetratricopeptide (TPR) repeat protein
MKRLAPVLLVVAVTGCAYFNGVYNARQAEKRGDDLLRRGREAEAASHFATVAEKAETVLVRHGDSKWADDARFLAGRGWAHAGQCARAVPHLEQALANDPLSAERREEARLALGICRLEDRRYAEAESLLSEVMTSGDRWRASQAAIWAARSALRRNATADALEYLSNTGASVAEWELIAAFVAQQELAPAESLLALRAADGDYRPELLTILPKLWAAGRRAGVARIMQGYDESRLRPGQRARLHLAYGDLLQESGADSMARSHFESALRLARDSLPGRQASVRLTALAIRSLPSQTDIEQAIARTAEFSSQVPIQARLERNLLFLHILLNRTDYTGASLFLAGEVARDSLGARALAHDIFLRVPDSYGNSPVAPKGLLAAADLRPDSAGSYLGRLRAQYPNSLYTLALDGKDTPVIGRINRGDQLLQQAWTLGTKALSDSLNALRRAAEARQNPNVAATGAPAPTGVPPQ